MGFLLDKLFLEMSNVPKLLSLPTSISKLPDKEFLDKFSDIDKADKPMTTFGITPVILFCEMSKSCNF